VSEPSDPQFTSYGCRFRDAFMSPLTVGEMTDSAAEKGEVQRWNPKLLQQEGPKVHHDHGPDTDKKARKTNSDA